MLGRRKRERQLESELHFHLERQIADFLAAGLEPEEARRRARLDFGGLEQIKESCREERKGRYVEEVFRDLRYGARMLAKSRRTVAISVLAIALGVGANMAAYSIADAFLLHPLLLPDIDRLVLISATERGQSKPWQGFPPADYLDWRAAGRSFESILAWNEFTDNLAGDGDPEVVSGMRVSSNFFRTLGVAPLVGQGMSEGDDDDPAAVLSYGLWVRRFGANPDAIGKTIRLHERSYRIAGVMPKQFRYLPEADLWIPLILTPQQRVDRRGAFLYLTAKLRPGVGLRQANSELTTLSRQLASAFPESHRERGAQAVSLAKRVRPDDDNGDAYIYMLWVSAGLVLLVATANVANLQFARVSLRAREMAMRTALGASRWRLVRQLLTENGILGILACVAGAGMAFWTVWALRFNFPPKDTRYLSGWDHFSVNPGALVYGLGVAVLAGLLAGIFPALLASSAAPAEQLKEGDRGASAGRRRHRLRSAFVVIQVSLSVVLLAGAVVVAKSIWSFTEPLPNTDPQSALTLRMILRESEYSDAVKMRAFEQQLMDAFHAIPGMEQIALVSNLPYSGETDGGIFRIQGRPDAPLSRLPGLQFQAVSPEYFAAIHIPIVQGRGFDSSDSVDSLPVAVVSEALVRQQFAGENPLGRKIKMELRGPNAPWLTIVGVAGDIAALPAEAPSATLYRPFVQEPPRAFDLLLRPSSPPRQIETSVLAKLRELDASQPAYDVQTLQELYDSQVAPLKGAANLMNVLGGLALALAAMGVFSVVVNTAVERQKEVAIRVTFGARMGSVVWMVLRQAMGLTLAGAVLGTAGAVAFSRVLAASIPEIHAPSAWLYLEVALFLATIAIPACYFPARRAALADPAAILRGE
jgi:putative ABC transport system permease protein